MSRGGPKSGNGGNGAKSLDAAKVQLYIALLTAAAGGVLGVSNRIWPEESAAAKTAEANAEKAEKVSKRGYAITQEAVNLLIERTERLEQRTYRLEDLALRGGDGPGSADVAELMATLAAMAEKEEEDEEAAAMADEEAAAMMEEEDPYEDLDDPDKDPPKARSAVKVAADYSMPASCACCNHVGRVRPVGLPAYMKRTPSSAHRP